MIKKLVELRIDTFIKEFDIDINSFDLYSMYNTRKVKWEQIKQKFIKCNFLTNKCYAYDCYLVINNIIWKNIMGHDIIDNKMYIRMYHNNFQSMPFVCYIFHEYYPILSYDRLLYKKVYRYPELKDNCFVLETKIINYIMLLDILVTEYMISDLIYTLKMYIFNVMLEL